MKAMLKCLIVELGLLLLISTIAETHTPPVRSALRPVGSSSSILAVDPAYIFQARINYANYQSADFPTDPGFTTLVRFKLTDGDGVTPDADALPTVLESLTLSITNPADVRRIALYDQSNTLIPGTEQNVGGSSTITFTTLHSFLSAADDNSATFTVRASFNGVVSDLDPVQLNVTNAVANPGSQFNNVPVTLIGGVAGGAITPAGKNLLDVVATQLVFSTQPDPVAGINQPLTQPKVKAVDGNGLVDTEVTSGVTLTTGVGTAGGPTTFSSGVLTFSGFQYTTPGNGTLTVSVSGPPALPSVTSNHVDVIHVTGSLASGGVATATELVSSSKNNVIFGFTLDAVYSVPGAPLLDEFTIKFGNPIAGALVSYRIYASLDASLNKITDKDITPFVTTVAAGDSLRVLFSAGSGWDDFLQPKPGLPLVFDNITGSTHLSYFLEVEISPTANITLPSLTPSVKRLSFNGITATHLKLEQASSFINVTGQTYTFKDLTKPTISSSIPFAGQVNQTANADVVLTFSEPVKALDGKISIFDLQLKKFVAELTTVDPIGTLRTSFKFKTTYIDPVTSILTNFLLPDSRYYIIIPGVNTDATTGFIDAYGNAYDGIADYSYAFKTSSILPPVVTNGAIISDISLKGATLSIGTDQPGTVFYMVVTNPSLVPASVNEITGTSTYTGGTVITRGSLPIVQPNTYQFGIINATLINNGKYDVYLFAQNDASVPVVGGILPVVSFVAKDPIGAGAILQAPTINICPGGFIKVFSPISVLERNIDDFQNNDGDFTLALPSGFIFNTAAPPVLTISGPDFTGPDSIMFLNNTLLRVVFKNTTATGFDRITISGLEIKATLTNSSGNITKLYGSALPTISPSAVWGAVKLKSRTPVDFTNSENGAQFFSDDAKNIQLIPLASDLGLNVFSGPGTLPTSDSLYVKLAGVGVNDITLMHTYEDGCIVTQTKFYTVFEHARAIAGLDKTQYCTIDATTPVPYDGRGATVNAPFFLKSLTVDIPTAALIDSIQPLGKFYRSLVKSSLTKSDSVVVGGNLYRSYQFNPSVFNLPKLTQLFSTATGGGLLGQIVFTAVYVSGLTGRESVLLLKVQINVPPAPVILASASGLNPTFPSQFCENLGNIILTSQPVPVAGQRTASYLLNWYNPATKAYQPVSFVGVLTDLNNGTAIIDTKGAVTKYGYDSLRIDYMVHSLTSTCDGMASFKFRVTPNPVALFTAKSAACALVDLKFIDASTISTAKPDFGITEWRWNFDDPNYFSSSNPNILVGGSSSANPIHRYTQPVSGGYHPSLIVKSKYGCESAPKSVNVTVGGVPVVAFSYTGVTAPITLTSTATVFEPNGIDSTDFFYRKKLFTPIKNKKDTSFTRLTAGQPFVASEGIYDMKLRVKSKLGCINTLTKKVVVLTLKTVTNSKPYVEKFESLDSGGWQIMPDTLAASWRVGNPGTKKTVIKGNPTITGKAFWYTGRNGSYNSKEKSYLYSNVYDISALDRPLVTFNSIVQMEQSDGVVFQYSLDNKNVGDSTKVWITLGSFDSGISSGVNWYNAQGLASKPGNQTTKDYGWTGNAATQWVESRHSMDALVGQHRVVFRFALSSVKNNPGLDGFGLDNVRIGNRTRTVLIESFANTSNALTVNGKVAEKTESDAIRAFENTKEGIEVIKMTYHVNFPGLDPFNNDFPAAPSSRSLFYGVDKTPASVMDGKGSPDAATPYFSQWGERQFQLRTLKLGLADITISPLPGNTSITDKGVISMNVSVTAIEPLTTRTVLHLVVLEQLIPLGKLPASSQSLARTGETDFAYVVKQMIPSAGGTRFTADLPAQGTRQFGPFTWAPEAKKFYNTSGTTNLAIVAFLQSDDTNEVLQTVMIGNLAAPNPALVTGTEPMPADDILVYPNPADGEFTIALPRVATNPMILTLMDQLGTTVETGHIAIGQQQQKMSTQSLSPGLYILGVGEGETVVRKRVVVMHR